MAISVSAEDVGDLAVEAARQLEDAANALDEAEGANDRITALSATVRAYESGLSAMREGLRRAALDERALRVRLAEEDERLSNLLSVLIALERAPDSRTLLHPGGAIETARAGMLMTEVVPALQAEAEALAADLRAQKTLRSLQEAGIGTLRDGLDGIREARLALSNAISERTDLPPEVATDEATIEALINSTETLAAFADSLSGKNEIQIARFDPPWRLPVAGDIIRSFNEADAAGIRRPGWIIATDPVALVTSPVPATVRFSGSLPEYGNVVILEPASTQLLILAGLGETFPKRGQIVSEGEAIGWMSGKKPDAQEKLIETSRLGGQPRSETLYMELRQVQKPVDPAIYFAPGAE